MAGPNLISTRVPAWFATGFTLTTDVVPSCSGRSSMRLPRVVTASEPFDAMTLPATTRRPLPCAPRVGSRQSLVDTKGRLMREHARDVLRRPVEAAAIVLDKVAAAAQPPDLDGSFVQRVVGKLLEHQPPQQVRRDASPLLQPLDGAEAGPVLALKPDNPRVL